MSRFALIDGDVCRENLLDDVRLVNMKCGCISIRQGDAEIELTPDMVSALVDALLASDAREQWL